MLEFVLFHVVALIRWILIQDLIINKVYRNYLDVIYAKTCDVAFVYIKCEASFKCITQE